MVATIKWASKNKPFPDSMNESDSFKGISEYPCELTEDL